MMKFHGWINKQEGDNMKLIVVCQLCNRIETIDTNSTIDWHELSVQDIIESELHSHLDYSIWVCWACYDKIDEENPDYIPAEEWEEILEISEKDKRK